MVIGITAQSALNGVTMKETIGETRPLVLDQLFKISANFYVVTEWTPVSMAKGSRGMRRMK